MYQSTKNANSSEFEIYHFIVRAMKDTKYKLHKKLVYVKVETMIIY